MRYTQQAVWNAVYAFIPEYIAVNKMGPTLNLGMAVRDAVEAFLDTSWRAGKPEHKMYAAYILHDTLTEIKEVGWMTFGTLEKFEY